MIRESVQQKEAVYAKTLTGHGKKPDYTFNSFFTGGAALTTVKGLRNPQTRSKIHTAGPAWPAARSMIA